MNVTQLSKYAGDRIRSKNQQGQHYKAPSIKNTKSCLEASINAAQQAHYTFYVRQTRRYSKALYIVVDTRLSNVISAHKIC